MTFINKKHYFSLQNSPSDTPDDNFLEDIVDEPQVMLKSILNDMDISNVVETWKIRRVEGISHKENLVVLFTDGSHIWKRLQRE